MGDCNLGNVSNTLVGQKAPDFKATAVINGGEIVENWSLGQFFGKN